MLASSILIVFSGISVLRIKASSIEELKMNYANVIKECIGDYPITAEDVEIIKAQIPNDMKCIFACAYKKTGMMTEQGMLSVEGVKEMGQTYFSDDLEKLRKNEEFVEACKSVNDEQVSDGDKGCERAALIYSCSIEKMANFGFDL